MTDTAETLPAVQPDFRSFSKIPRLFSDVIITEKIDGTNGQIYITEYGDMFVGSRNRWLAHGSDNFGFHTWATAHKQELLELGPGRHYGEWWGSGVQRGYGLMKGEKRFSLFNVSRWYDLGTTSLLLDGSFDRGIPPTAAPAPACCRVVPVLFSGDFSTEAVAGAQAELQKGGSWAAPGFDSPEGVMIYHVRAGTYFKAPFDPLPKGPQPE